LGPRRSLDLSDIGTLVVLFGDETSFGLGAALRGNAQSTDSTYVFEVSDFAESRRVLEAIDLKDAILIERTADETHLAGAKAALVRLAAKGAQIVLTGKASSIQQMSRALKAAGVGSARVKAKAYWTLGKTGLD
jgi:NADPH-dependent ferric siderophore reductase